VAAFDLPLDELERYAPRLPEPEDFDEFWAITLEEAREHPLDIRLEPVDSGLVAVQTWDVSFNGFGGHRIRGWLHIPRLPSTTATGQLPAVVQYQGYGGGRGLAHESVLWAAAGYAHFVMDTRGQGSGWSTGDTPDPTGSGPAHPGFMTRGILHPRDYYYRRVFVDGIRAVAAVRGNDAIDSARIVVTGVSQGGGIALAVAGLLNDVAAVMADVPGPCDWQRAIEVTDRTPYAEVTDYLRVHRDHRDEALRTLSYFDCAILSRRARAPALFSVALMDHVCPPSTVYAAFNAYAGPKAIHVYPYNDHEGGEGFQQAEQLSWLRDLFATQLSGSTATARAPGPPDA
jgi:cephalosporin-C deacetylase